MRRAWARRCARSMASSLLSGGQWTGRTFMARLRASKARPSSPYRHMLWSIATCEIATRNASGGRSAADAEGEDGLRFVLLTGFQDRRRKLRLVRRVGEMLRLEAEPRSAAVDLAALPLQR